ncbi:hypothetical protein CL656_05420 [bacterium]|nr:hypothetical protein [bacterium]
MAAAENHNFNYPLENHHHIQPPIKKEMFELNNKYYVIQYGSNTKQSFSSNSIRKDNPIYNMEEFLQQDSGTYLWVMGKDENGKLHTVFIKTKNIHEIGTTHSNIVHRIFSNHNYDRNLIPKINILLYAGEIKLNQEEKKIIINFLSGTFMLGRLNLNKENNVNKAFNNVLRHFHDTIGNSNYTIEYDNSKKTFIDKKITISQLIEYFNSGLSIYEFNDETEAKNFLSNPLKIIKLKAKKDMMERVKEAYRNKNGIIKIKTKINNLEKNSRKEKLNLEQLENIQREILLQEGMGKRKQTNKNGGKKRKNRKNRKTKRKIRKNKRKTKKYSKKN